MSAERKLHSLADLVRETGIPRQSLRVLLEHYEESIPSLLDGDRRCFPPDAIPVITRLWREYKRGVSKGKEPHDAWYLQAPETLAQCGTTLVEVAKRLRELERKLRANPPATSFFINALPGTALELLHPIGVVVDVRSKTQVRARLVDAGLEAYGDTDAAAVMSLRELLMCTFLRLEGQEEVSSEEAEQRAVLSQLMRRRRAGEERSTG